MFGIINELFLHLFSCPQLWVEEASGTRVMLKSPTTSLKSQSWPSPPFPSPPLPSPASHRLQYRPSPPQFLSNQLLNGLLLDSLITTDQRWNAPQLRIVSSARSGPVLTQYWHFYISTLWCTVTTSCAPALLPSCRCYEPTGFQAIWFLSACMWLLWSSLWSARCIVGLVVGRVAKMTNLPTIFCWYLLFTVEIQNGI